MDKSMIFVLSLVGAIVLIVGLVLEWYANEKIITYAVEKKAAIVEGGEILPFFEKMPQPFIIKVYFYNVTNPEEVSAGALPKIVEVGPYVYDQWREKLNITFNADNDTVSYNAKKTFHFNEKLSKTKDNLVLSESDQVTILNMPLMGTLLSLEIMDASLASFFDSAIPQLYNHPRTIFLTGTVKDLLFDGVMINCTTKDMIENMICRGMAAQLPSTVRPDGQNFLFSFLHHQNGTSPNRTTVYSGVRDPSLLNSIQKFDEKSEFEAWSNYCNKMNGTDSSQFQTMISNYNRVYVFEPEFCVSLWAEREFESTYQGVDIVRFSTVEKLLATPKYNIENECFCITIKNGEGQEDKVCPDRGTLNMFNCLRTPMIISFPHFYLGDRELRNYSGLSDPKKALHETFVDLERYTGMPVNGSKRLQFNMMLKKIEDITLLTNVSEGLFPIIWLEEGTEMNEQNLNLLQQKLSLIRGLKIGTLVVIGAGVIIIVIAYICYAKKQKILCFDDDVDAGAKNKVHVAQNGVNGTYAEKINSVSMYDKNGDKTVAPTDVISRRQSNNNSGTYMENFM